MHRLPRVSHPRKLRLLTLNYRRLPLRRYQCLVEPNSTRWCRHRLKFQPNRTPERDLNRFRCRRYRRPRQLADAHQTTNRANLQNHLLPPHHQYRNPSEPTHRSRGQIPERDLNLCRLHRRWLLPRPLFEGRLKKVRALDPNYQRPPHHRYPHLTEPRLRQQREPFRSLLSPGRFEKCRKQTMTMKLLLTKEHAARLSKIFVPHSRPTPKRLILFRKRLFNVTQRVSFTFHNPKG